MHWLKNRDGTWTVTPRNYPDGTCMNCRVRPGLLYPWGYYTCWLCARATGERIGCEKGVDVEVVVRNTVLGYLGQEISVESVNHKYGPEGLE